MGLEMERTWGERDEKKSKKGLHYRSTLQNCRKVFKAESGDELWSVETGNEGRQVPSETANQLCSFCQNNRETLKFPWKDISDRFIKQGQ